MSPGSLTHFQNICTGWDMNGVISKHNSTYNIENMRAIRTLPARYARHTHAQRVCWINGFWKNVSVARSTPKTRGERAFLVKFF